jgi:hypothetical protein
LEEIHSLIETTWTSGRMPEKWYIAVIHPIHKKGDTLHCSNYRGFSLLNVSYKIRTNILHRQLVPYAVEIFGEYQRGFRIGHSATDNLFMLRCTLEIFYKFHLDLHLFFTDFQQALIR